MAGRVRPLYRRNTVQRKTISYSIHAKCVGDKGRFCFLTNFLFAQNTLAFSLKSDIVNKKSGGAEFLP